MTLILMAIWQQFGSADDLHVLAIRRKRLMGLDEGHGATIFAVWLLMVH